jgi:16S rRNA (adenine1518-N6/adenine1519-N6)-dimethyltransferase
MPKYLSHRRKRLGQVFLRDPLVVEKILQSAQLAPQETVLEIGPGRGTLTAALARQASALYAVEIDAAYVHTLHQRFAATPHVHIIQADARTYDYSLLPHPLVVIANLPYSMGMAILTHLLAGRQHLSRLIIMLQKEVAERLLAPPGTSAYGALTVFFQYYTVMTHCFDVSRQAFTPVPAVDSTVLKLVPYTTLPLPSSDEQWLFRLVKYAFVHRRKTLRANLLAAADLALTKATLEDVFVRLALSSNVRAQELHVSQFMQLAEALRHLVVSGQSSSPLSPRERAGGEGSLAAPRPR